MPSIVIGRGLTPFGVSPRPATYTARAVRHSRLAVEGIAPLEVVLADIALLHLPGRREVGRVSEHPPLERLDEHRVVMALHAHLGPVALGDRITQHERPVEAIGALHPL